MGQHLTHRWFTYCMKKYWILSNSLQLFQTLLFGHNSSNSQKPVPTGYLMSRSSLKWLSISTKQLFLTFFRGFSVQFSIPMIFYSVINRKLEKWLKFLQFIGNFDSIIANNLLSVFISFPVSKWFDSFITEVIVWLIFYFISKQIFISCKHFESFKYFETQLKCIITLNKT